MTEAGIIDPNEGRSRRGLRAAAPPPQGRTRDRAAGAFRNAPPASPLSQRAISCQAPPNVRRPMNSDRCRPGTTRTATLVARHSDFAANACGKATISSSEAARMNIGASMSDNRAGRPSAAKQPRARRFSRKCHPPFAGSRRRANRPHARSRRRTFRSARSRRRIAELLRRCIHPPCAATTGQRTAPLRPGRRSWRPGSRPSWAGPRRAPA